MTKQRLKKLQGLLKEVDQLENMIRSMPFTFGGYVGDTVKDGRTGYPKTMLIQGYSTEKYDKAKLKLKRKLENIQDEIAELEDWLNNVDDPETRNILRLQYINGLTHEEIAQELGYARETISRKLQIFWKQVTESHKTSML